MKAIRLHRQGGSGQSEDTAPSAIPLTNSTI